MNGRQSAIVSPQTAPKWSSRGPALFSPTAPDLNVNGSYATDERVTTPRWKAPGAITQLAKAKPSNVPPQALLSQMPLMMRITPVSW